MLEQDKCMDFKLRVNLRVKRVKLTLWHCTTILPHD